MTNASKLAKKPGGLAPSSLPTPKRGAFPTPKSEIEKAKPFVPDIDRTDDRSETKPTAPTRVDEKKGG